MREKYTVLSLCFVLLVISSAFVVFAAAEDENYCDADPRPYGCDFLDTLRSDSGSFVDLAELVDPFIPGSGSHGTQSQTSLDEVFSDLSTQMTEDDAKKFAQMFGSSDSLQGVGTEYKEKIFDAMLQASQYESSSTENLDTMMTEIFKKSALDSESGSSVPWKINDNFAFSFGDIGNVEKVWFDESDGDTMRIQIDGTEMALPLGDLPSDLEKIEIHSDGVHYSRSDGNTVSIAGEKIFVKREIDLNNPDADGWEVFGLRGNDGSSIDTGVDVVASFDEENPGTVNIDGNMVSVKGGATLTLDEEVTLFETRGSFDISTDGKEGSRVDFEFTQRGVVTITDATNAVLTFSSEDGSSPLTLEYSGEGESLALVTLFDSASDNSRKQLSRETLDAAAAAKNTLIVERQHTGVGQTRSFETYSLSGDVSGVSDLKVSYQSGQMEGTIASSTDDVTFDVLSTGTHGFSVTDGNVNVLSTPAKSSGPSTSNYFTKVPKSEIGFNNVYTADVGGGKIGYFVKAKDSDEYYYYGSDKEKVINWKTSSPYQQGQIFDSGGGFVGSNQRVNVFKDSQESSSQGTSNSGSTLRSTGSTRPQGFSFYDAKKADGTLRYKNVYASEVNGETRYYVKDSKGFYHDFGSDIDNLQKVEGNIYYNDGRKWSAPTGPKSGCRGNRCSANGRSYFSSTQQDYNNNRISRNEYYKNKVIMLNKDSVSYTG